MQEDWSAKIIDNASINDLDPVALKLAKEKSTKSPFYNESNIG